MPAWTDEVLFYHRKGTDQRSLELVRSRSPCLCIGVESGLSDSEVISTVSPALACHARDSHFNGSVLYSEAGKHQVPLHMGPSLVVPGEPGSSFLLPTSPVHYLRSVVPARSRQMASTE